MDCDLKISGICSGRTKKCVQCGKNVCRNCAIKFCHDRECDYAICSKRCFFYSNEEHNQHILNGIIFKSTQEEDDYFHEHEMCDKCDRIIKEKRLKECNNCGNKFCRLCCQNIIKSGNCIECKIKIKESKNQRCTNCECCATEEKCLLCDKYLCDNCISNRASKCHLCGIILCYDCKYDSKTDKLYIPRSIPDKEICIDCEKVMEYYHYGEIDRKKYEDIIEYLSERKFYGLPKRDEDLLDYLLKK